MNTKSYIKKYNLSQTNKFSHNEFIGDMALDFVSLLETSGGAENYKLFEAAIDSIKAKWNAISNKTVYGLPEKLWGFFYATVIVKTKEELYPELVASENARREEKKQMWEDRKKARMEENNWIWDFLFSGFEISRKPLESYTILGLTSNASKEEVKAKYRELALVYHPDKGGNKDMFLEITEAKNKIIASL